MSSNAWNALRDGLYKRFSTGADVILFEMGRSHGSELVAALVRSKENKAGESWIGKNKPDPRDFSRIVVTAGWGKVSLSGDLELGTHISVAVTNCVFCTDDDNHDHRCPFLREVTIGIANTFCRRDYNVSENCSVESKEHYHVCKFELWSK